MPTQLLIAIVAITAALVFYTVGVWMERIQKRLKWGHLILFALGLICDSTGTYFMSLLADEENASGMASLHGITGLIAILLMVFHAAWALGVLLKGTDKAKEQFHKFSIFVWVIWLIPFILGMVMGMSN